jgi:hypothetical protein
LFTTHGYDIKNAAHCLRLLHMGVELMETGVLNVNRTGIDAEQLREVKSGRWSLGQVQREAERGFARMRALRPTTSLPSAPDRDRVESLVIDTLERAMAGIPALVPA